MDIQDNIITKATVKVTSQPLKEVIENIAEAWNVEVQEACSEYSVDIPVELGEGFIRGISFDNGLGVIVYECRFNKEVSFEFTLNNVHPVKYLYSVKGPTIHRFANEEAEHIIAQKKCALVASSQYNGHILSFKNNHHVNLISLEINRAKFVPGLECELDEISDELYDVLTDVDAKKTFYHEGHYGIDFEYLLENISKFRGTRMLRKMHLLSLALDIFVKQVKLFEDDKKLKSNQQILRANEKDGLNNVTDYIRSNIGKKLSLDELSQIAGLNENKLQMGFKFIHNMTVMEFVRTVRLRDAARLLRDTNKSISEISTITGFESPSYFAKSFSKVYGHSPKTYRQNH